MKKNFEALQTNASSMNLVHITALSQPRLGEQAILDSSKVVFSSNSDLDWSAVAAAFSLEKTCGILKTQQGDFFCEALDTAPNLIICGAGHVSMPIIKIAKLVGFNVTVLDDRPSFTSNALAAGADQVVCDSFLDGLESLPKRSNCFYIIVTRGHRYDRDCIKAVLNLPRKYIGVMSSRARIAILKKELKTDGISPELIGQIKSPIGLDISSETPEEIAVSIMAEIIKTKNLQKNSFGFPPEFLEEYSKSKEFGAALCTIISRKGSAPREIGSKMIVLENGFIINTIGGGCVEAEVRNLALDVIKTGTAQRTTCNMTKQQAEDEGMVCGGIIEVLIQPIC